MEGEISSASPRQQRRVGHRLVAMSLAFGLWVLTSRGPRLPNTTRRIFSRWRMPVGVERERQVVEQACDVCETWIARVLPVTPVIHGAHWIHVGPGTSVTVILTMLLVTAGASVRRGTRVLT